MIASRSYHTATDVTGHRLYGNRPSALTTSQCSGLKYEVPGIQATYKPYNGSHMG